MTISDNLRRQVIEAANYRCEYCKTSSRLIGTPLVMEELQGLITNLQAGTTAGKVTKQYKLGSL